MWQLNPLVESVVEYISGFVIKKMLKSKLMCKFCKPYLMGTHDDEYSLIKLKNRGGLASPSKDVTIICKTAELVIRENLHKIFAPNSKTILANLIKRRCSATVFNCVRLAEHTKDQNSLNNHAVQMIHSIITLYLNVRLFYEAKLSSEKNEYIRNKYTKLILFKNQ